MEQKPPVFLSYAFRPFFLFNAVFAVCVILVWVLSLHSGTLPGLTPLWHAHEMLVGFAMAALAGFSLTAVASWTGRPAIHGVVLGWLVCSWLAGRFGMALGGWLPAPLVAALDMLFPLFLVFLLGREVVLGGSGRNRVLVLILALMAAFNGLYHLGTGSLGAPVAQIAVFLLVHAVLLLLTIIAGRIVPSFTVNWLRMRDQNHQRMPVDSPQLQHALLWMVVATGLAASLWPMSPVTGTLAFATALLHALRLSRWRGLATFSNPLLFMLHVAYAWLAMGYFLTGLAVFGWLISPTAALHALTMGAIGSMILAVTTRVTLGHTGRPLQAAPAIVMAYCLFTLAVWVRVLGSLVPGRGLLMMDIAASGWILTFLIFLKVYWPFLTRPRR